MIDLGLFSNLETFGLIGIAVVSVILFVLIGLTSMKYLKLFGISGGVGFIISLLVATLLTYGAFSLMETVILSIWFWAIVIIILILLLVIKIVI